MTTTPATTAPAAADPRDQLGRRAAQRSLRALPLVLAAALGSTGLVPAAASEAEPPVQPLGGDAPADRAADRAAGRAADRDARGTAPTREDVLASPVPVLAAPSAPTYTVRAGDTVSAIAARTGASQRDIVAANGLDARASIRAGQLLRLGTTTPAPASAPAGATYTVRAGDTVSAIAARTGASQRDIVAANGLDARASIRAGQLLRLGTATPAPAPAPASAPAGGGATYTVRAGDTVSTIAARTGASQRDIVAANGLDARASIRAGQLLRLGTATAAPERSNDPARSGGGTYTVRDGDSLGLVAQRQGTTVAEMRRLNPGVGADALIRVGQRLSVPTPGASTSAPVSSTFLGRTYPSSTTAAATANRDVLAARAVPGREEMRRLVADTARRYGVDPALAQAVAFQESSFDMRSVSPANAVGVMQVIPSSGRWAGDLVGRPLDLLDPADNVTAGVAILRQLQRTSPDVATALAGYYQGAASVRENGMYPDTRRYVARVQTLAASYR